MISEVQPANSPCKPRNARGGFTLLEVLLASAIGVMLMAALYKAVDMQLRHAQAGRDIVEQSTLARAILSRIGRDLRACLGTVPASNGAGSAGGAAGGTTGTTTGAATGGTTGGTTAGSSTAGAATAGGATGTTSSGASGGPTTQSANTGTTGLAFEGDQTDIQFFVGKVATDPAANPDPNSLEGQFQAGDIRRICYWLVSGGEQGSGLARQETGRFTAQDIVAATPPNIPDEQSYIISEEVKELQFSYWDGTNWNDTWDATTLGADGVTPIGPPVAIAISIGIEAPTSDGRSEIKRYRDVIVLPTANGTTQSALAQSNASSGSTTSGTTGTTSGSPSGTTGNQ